MDQSLKSKKQNVFREPCDTMTTCKGMTECKYFPRVSLDSSEFCGNADGPKEKPKCHLILNEAKVMPCTEHDSLIV